MGLPFHVKLRFLLLAAAALALPLRAAEERPPAQEILRSVRLSQTGQRATLKGQLRTGPKTVPFRLSLSGPIARYEFSDPAETIVLNLGEKESRLSEVTKEGAERVTGRKFAESVRGTDISYEDLSLRFLYWQNAAVEDEQSILLRKCWVVRVAPPANSDSQYSRVTLWVDKESGALMQAEAFDRAGKFARRFKVISGQKIDGAWYLKQMRIEAPASGGKGKTPTYLEVEGVER
jgi:hypothetical protein